MTTWSPNDIAGFIYLVGGWGPGSKAKAPEFLDVAIAVCLAESGGREDAQNPPASNPAPAQYAIGLWQIMYPVHKDLLDQYGESYSTHAGTIKSQTHPLVNTSAARDLQKSQGWEPWTAYKSGAYRSHLGYGKSAYAYISKKENIEALQAKMADYGANFNTTVKTDNTSWQDVIAGFPAYFVARLKEMGISIGIFIVGLIVLALGVWLIASKNPKVKKASKDIAMAALIPK